VKTQEVLEHLREALSAARMERIDIGSETEHIKEVTKLYRETWIVNPILQAIQTIEASLPHKFQPWFEGSQTCGFCRKGHAHKLHD